jgi:hypothetical protein
MTAWRDKLEQIRKAQIAIMRDEPYRDFGLVPNPGASEIAIRAAEARLGIELPRGYRDFLRVHDGWPRFYEGATLLGTANLGKREYEDVAQAVFRAAETPVPHIAPPASAARRRRPLIPFGADLQGATLFAFDARTRSADTELPVVAWVNELGMTFDSFESFLDGVHEWLTHERQLEAARLLASA